TVGGRSWDFSAATVRPPSGLYRAMANVRNAEFVGGWIVVDGEQVGLGVLDGDVVAVPPVDPGSATVYIDGVGGAVHMVDGPDGRGRHRCPHRTRRRVPRPAQPRRCSSRSPSVPRWRLRSGRTGGCMNRPESR